MACTAVSNDQIFEEKRVNSNYSPASPNKTLVVNQLLSVDCNTNAAESTHPLSPSPGVTIIRGYSNFLIEALASILKCGVSS